MVSLGYRLTKEWEEWACNNREYGNDVDIKLLGL